MTQRTGDYSPPHAREDGGPTPEVAQAAAAGGSQVAGVAAEQVKEVAAEAKHQVGDLVAQGVGQLREQARATQEKAVDGLYTVADHLQDMSEGSEKGVAADVVREVAHRTKSVASWLDAREPGDLLDEVRGFARRKPGAFLAGAAVAGLLLGRVTRGAMAAKREEPDAEPSAPRHAEQAAAEPAMAMLPPEHSLWEPGQGVPEHAAPEHAVPEQVQHPQYRQPPTTPMVQPYAAQHPMGRPQEDPHPPRSAYPPADGYPPPAQPAPSQGGTYGTGVS